MQWLHDYGLKKWRIEDLHDKLKECFIRIGTKYLKNPQHIGIVFIK